MGNGRQCFHNPIATTYFMSSHDFDGNSCWRLLYSQSLSPFAAAFLCETGHSMARAATLPQFNA